MPEPKNDNGIKITPDEHSDVVGGSTADRVVACPGSVKLNRTVKAAHKARITQQVIEAHGIVVADDGTMSGVDKSAFAAAVEAAYREETTSTYAAEGTGLHEAMAWILENDEEPESVVDRTFEGVLITPELYEECVVPALQGFDDYCDRVFEEDGEELIFTVEERCQLPGIEGAFGTSDIIGKTKKRMVIWDWKFGAGVAVSPVENNQLRFYARAAAHTKRAWFDFVSDDPAADTRPGKKQVDLVISQPRIGDGEPQVWTTTYQDLEDFRLRLVDAVELAMQDDAPVQSGPHCKWCEAKHICPAKQQLGQRIVERVKVKAAPKTSEVSFTPQDVADWLQDADDIETWVKHVRALAFAELKAGRSVVGKELDQGLGNAAWLPDLDDKTLDHHMESYGLSLEDRRVVKPVSPTVARKAVKATGDKEKMALLETIIHRPVGGIKMVPAGTAKNPVKLVSEQVASIAEKLRGKSDV